MAKMKFEDLSVDIKTLVVQHIARPTDLRNVCLVNHQLHEIAVRELYRKVSLEIGSPNDHRLAAFLNPKNIGLPHIRELDLYLFKRRHTCNQLEQARFAVGMILELLPENILEDFSWLPWEDFSGDHLVLLYKKQKRLKRLEGIALDKNVLEKIQKIPNWQSVFTNVKQLGLYPENRDVLDLCHFLVKNTPKLDQLILNANFDKDGDRAIPERELSDSSTGPGLVTSTIFAHLQPFAECTPLALKELTLDKVGLRYAADTYCKIIDFRTVRRLWVCWCPGADALFAELSKSAKLPEKLEKLHFRHCDNDEQDGLGALDGFLCLVTGIEQLTLDFSDVKSLPAIAGIVRQAKTLKLLNVHTSERGEVEREIVYDASTVFNICKSCKEIEQLSMAFPEVSAIEDDRKFFFDREDCLSKLANLVTLNITTWPKSCADDNNEPPYKIYENLLQRLAQSGFDRSEQHASSQDRTSKLQIIAFGVSDKVYDRKDSRKQIIFVKGKSIDPLGKERATAIAMGWCLRKFIDAGPKSHILEQYLTCGRSPPCEGASDSEDSF